MLHASGKFVPQILALVGPGIPPEDLEILKNYQDLVMKSLSAKDDESIVEEMKNSTEKVKSIALEFKKGKGDD